MLEFQTKINEITKLQKQIDEIKKECGTFIWNIFRRYIEEFNILFSHPHNYFFCDEGIYFEGDDGCMGYYDAMSQYIPYEFFTNTEEAFKQAAIEREELKLKEAEKIQKAIDEKELKEFNRLKEKFGETK